MTKEKQNELLEAAKPLIKWLNENSDPYSKAIVDIDSVELLHSKCTNKTDEFIKD